MRGCTGHGLTAYEWKASDRKRPRRKLQSDCRHNSKSRQPVSVQRTDRSQRLGNAEKKREKEEKVLLIPKGRLFAVDVST